ncbi:MAG: thioredoxin TrxC [Zetaproteobacteria bacterium]|nr:MAG: thioredoxin TrxC [Zetaproteobacteria bacterium]
MAETELYSCPACGAVNRLPADRLVAGEGHKIVCGKCRGKIFPGLPIEIGGRDFAATVLHAPLPVLVDFWAPWCGPCRMLGPVLERLAAQLAGRLIVVKVNIDEHAHLADRFSVRSVPTMMLFRRGQVVETMLGAMPLEALLGKIRPWLH